jgi:hypothetical protein
MVRAISWIIFQYQRTKTMNHAGARKRLKQKALERWENEGGKLVALQSKKDSSPKEKPKQSEAADRRPNKLNRGGKTNKLSRD